MAREKCSQEQGAKKIIFTACHLGKLKLAFTSPDVISTSTKNFLTSRIDFTVLLLFEFLKKHHLPVGQANNTSLITNSTRLKKKTVKTKDASSWNRLGKVKNKVNQEIKAAKKAYYNNSSNSYMPVINVRPGRPSMN